MTTPPPAESTVADVLRWVDADGWRARAEMALDVERSRGPAAREDLVAELERLLKPQARAAKRKGATE